MTLPINVPLSPSAEEEHLGEVGSSSPHVETPEGRPRTPLKMAKQDG